MDDSRSGLVHLFRKLDLRAQGRISVDDLVVLYRNLHMFPPRTHLKRIIAQADGNQDGVIDFDEFAEMRRKGLAIELNVLAEFKKYDVDSLQKGYLTRFGVTKVLREDGLDPVQVDVRLEEIMQADLDKDGKISYKDLYHFMLVKVPDQWLEWLDLNIKRNVNDAQLLQLMVQNGIRSDVAKNLITQTRRSGRQHVQPGYTEQAQGYVYTLRS